MFIRSHAAAKWRWAIALTLSLAISPQMAPAEDWIEPCNGYQAYVAAGGGDSAPALALQRVCALVGARRISQACLVYYTRKTADYPVHSAADLAADKAACAASMPGELSGEPAASGCGEGTECAPRRPRHS